ncbi:MAG: hypothetical protein D6766_09180, partial [Verrucomicrobia bacterium]
MNPATWINQTQESAMKRFSCRTKAAMLICLAGWLGGTGGQAATRLTLGTVEAVDTRPVTVPVTLQADGWEHALGWSVSFDPARLVFQQAILGPEAAGARLEVNGAAAGEGRVGFVVAMPPDTPFPGGEYPLVQLRFTARGGAGDVPVRFGDDPVVREAVDVTGNNLAASYADGVVHVQPLLPPTITRQPADLTIYAGANALFSVAVESAAPVTYQWQRDGADLPGATSALLALREVGPADAGLYRVIVSNPAGSVTSAEARLTVREGLRPDLIGQWDFDHGTLTATVGRDLAYRGNTAEVTTFQVQEIGGVPAGTMGFPRATRSQGYRLFHDAGGNGGGNRLNRYTIVFDVMFPASSDRRWRALLQTDPNNGQDAEFYVGPGNGLWISGDGGEHGQGTVTPDQWHRIAFAVDVSAGTVGKFVDGVLVHRHRISTTIDNAYSLGPEALLFTEDNNETAAGFVNSIQLYARTLTDGEVAEMGGPLPEGLPLGIEDQRRPAIVVQPAAQTVREGEAVTLTVVARGSAPLSYQWQKDGADLPGETGSQLTLAAVTAAETGDYTVVVTNPLGTVTSQPAAIQLSAEERTLSFGAVEVLQGNKVEVPVRLHALGGEQAFTASVQFDPEALRFAGAQGVGGASVLINGTELGEGRVGLAWSRPPGQPLAGGDATVLNLSFQAIGEAVATPLDWAATPLPASMAGVDGHDRAFTGVAGAVDILSAPRITAQPESTAGAPGGTVAFSVEVVGTEPLSYQWRFNGQNIAGATDPTLVLENLTEEQAGEYSVVISNRVGSAVSRPARLVVGRLLRVDDAHGFSAERVEAPLLLFALGDENSVGASVSFDPAQAELLEVVPGSQAPGATLLFNADQPGRVGIGVSLPAGQTFDQGWHEVARLAFRTAEPVSGLPLVLGDKPVTREVTDVLAEPLLFVSMDGSLTTTKRPIDVSQLPDLVPSDLTAPATAQLGQPVLIQWRVRNTGLQPAVAPWREGLFVAATPDGADRRLIAQINVSEDLPPDGEILRSQTLVLPPAAAGVNYLFVEVDLQQSVAERDETNNRTVSAGTITLRAPDLRPENLAGPASALQGAEITVSWDVANRGSADTVSEWVDRLLLVPALGTLADGLELAVVPAVTTPLGPDASYRQSVPVTLPLSHDWPPGAYRLVVVTDHGNAQLELDENNNTAGIPFELTTPPLPDLVVRSVTAPAAARPAEPFQVRWEVENIGTATARAPWQESISFVHPGTGERSLLLVDVTADLAPGARVARQAQVALPEASPSGDLRIAVATDVRDDVVEQNEANNRREAATPTAVTRVLTLVLPLAEIREDAAPPTFLARVVRSGDRSQPVTVTLENSDSTELQAPATVEIPAGRSDVSFNLRVLGDGMVDGPQTVTLRATAPGFDPAVATLTVLDVD